MVYVLVAIYFVIGIIVGIVLNNKTNDSRNDTPLIQFLSIIILACIWPTVVLYRIAAKYL